MVKRNTLLIKKICLYKRKVFNKKKKLYAVSVYVKQAGIPGVAQVYISTHNYFRPSPALGIKS